MTTEARRPLEFAVSMLLLTANRERAGSNVSHRCIYVEPSGALMPAVPAMRYASYLQNAYPAIEAQAMQE